MADRLAAITHLALPPVAIVILINVLAGCGSAVPASATPQPTTALRPPIPDEWMTLTTEKGDIQLVVPSDIELVNATPWPPACRWSSMTERAATCGVRTPPTGWPASASSLPPSTPAGNLIARGSDAYSYDAANRLVSAPLLVQSGPDRLRPHYYVVHTTLYGVAWLMDPKRARRYGSDPGLLVLISLAAGPRHGHAILRDIGEFSGARPGPGTLYGAIERLEEDGLIERHPTEDRRTPYRLTHEGARYLAGRADALERLVGIVRQRGSEA
jgi:DNA-binding PadR family transcriptional regulator